MNNNVNDIDFHISTITQASNELKRDIEIFKLYGKLTPYQFYFILNCRDTNMRKLMEIYYATSEFASISGVVRSRCALQNKKFISTAIEFAEKTNQTQVLNWLRTVRY